MNRTSLLCGGLAAATLTLGGTTHAASVYSTVLTPLNDSGVGGVVTLTLDGNQLTSQFAITGLEPSQPHVAHIHGRFDAGGTPIDSTSPTLADDTDGDGFVELGEGLPRYGPILLPFTTESGDAAFVTPDGNLTNSKTYDLSDSSIFNADFDADDLTPLDLREFVIHGLTVPAGAGAGTEGEVNGTGGYLAVLPAASGEFVFISSGGDDNGGPGPATPIPTPTAAVAGLSLLGLLAGRRRARAEA